MPWRSNGDYYNFGEEAILAHAPPFSGVYGLYTIKHQILIGHAPSIREALLRHLRETRFHFRRFEPTGFTFEVCPPEAREPRTQELICEFDPIIQRPHALVLGALWRSWTTPASRVFNPQSPVSKKPEFDRGARLSANIEEKGRFKGFHFGRKRFAMAAAACGVMVFVIGLPALLPHLETAADRLRSKVSLLTQKGIFARNEPTRLASLTPPPKALDSPHQSEQEMGFREPNTDPPPAQLSDVSIGQPNRKNDVVVETPSSNVPHRIDNGEIVSRRNQKAAQKPQTVRKEEARNPWAVQALASTDQRIASVWLNMLQAKGYDAYVIEAVIKGQTWYRVRAGNFTTRQEAEALRKVLQSSEGFRDAFVAGNSKSEILIASNLR